MGYNRSIGEGWVETFTLGASDPRVGEGEGESCSYPARFPPCARESGVISEDVTRSVLQKGKLRQCLGRCVIEHLSHGLQSPAPRTAVSDGRGGKSCGSERGVATVRARGREGCVWLDVPLCFVLTWFS